MSEIREKLGTGEIEILRRMASEKGHVLEQRPGGLWTTPSTGIFEGGHSRWWAVSGPLHNLRQLGLLRLRLGPRLGGSIFPELELTDAALFVISELGITVL